MLLSGVLHKGHSSLHSELQKRRQSKTGKEGYPGPPKELLLRGRGKTTRKRKTRNLKRKKKIKLGTVGALQSSHTPLIDSPEEGSCLQGVREMTCKFPVATKKNKSRSKDPRESQKDTPQQLSLYWYLFCG